MRYRDIRWPSDHPVVLLLGDRQIKARILNISGTGARLSLPEAPDKGARLSLDLQGSALGAEVRWVRGAQAGIRFDRPLTAREIGLIRKAERTQMRKQTSGWNLQLRELG